MDSPLTKTKFPFHIWFDLDYRVEGFAEVSVKPGKIWYSHLSFCPKSRKVDSEGNIVSFETFNSIYEVVSQKVDEDVIRTFRGQRYFPPLRNEVRTVDSMGRIFINAEDPYLDGEPIYGYLTLETEEWIEIRSVGSTKRSGDFRFLK